MERDRREQSKALIQCVQGPEGHGRLIVKRANLASSSEVFANQIRRENAAAVRHWITLNRRSSGSQDKPVWGVGWVQPCLSLISPQCSDSASDSVSFLTVTPADLRLPGCQSPCDLVSLCAWLWAWC